MTKHFLRHALLPSPRNACRAKNESIFRRLTGTSSGGEARGQLATADLPALTGRQRLEQINPLRHLPPAQSRPAKFQQRRLVGFLSGDHARDYFLMPQRRRAAKNSCLAYTLKTQQVCLDFGRIHLFSRDVNQVREPSHDLHSRLAHRHEIVGQKETAA